MQAHAAPAARRIARGLTLIEGCVVLAVASIVIGTAAPSFKKTSQRATLTGASANLVADFHYARSEAVARREGVRVTVAPASAGGICLLVHTGAASDCDCSPAGGQCSGSATLLKSEYFGPGAPLALSANVSSMRFDPVNGTVTPAGTVRLTTNEGAAVHHVVNILGRTRTCSPGAAVAGVSAC